MAIEIPDRLKEAAEQLNNSGPKNVTACELLSWFGAGQRDSQAYFRDQKIAAPLSGAHEKSVP